MELTVSPRSERACVIDSLFRLQYKSLQQTSGNMPHALTAALLHSVSAIVSGACEVMAMQ